MIGSFITSKVQAHISVKHNRIKSKLIEDRNVVYLKDGTEFQIELCNDSNVTVAAQISINGELQPSSLVLNPHQHIYLDRFFNSDKKFKFNTFMTGNDDIDTLKKIIDRNGKIEISFYEEDISLYNNIQCHTTSITGLYTYTSGDISVKYGDSNISKPSIPNEIETGRVEEGSKSNQKFESVYKTWVKFPFKVVNLHIMPESAMQMNMYSNVIKVDKLRSYCSTCGRKIKSGWNYCPGCGNKY